MLEDSLTGIREVRPGMALIPRAVLEAICLSESPIGSAEEVAHRLGLPNRFKLARIMKQEGLPPLHRIAEWATVQSWLRAAEGHGVSLCHLAFRSRPSPAASCCVGFALRSVRLSFGSSDWTTHEACRISALRCRKNTLTHSRTSPRFAIRHSLISQPLLTSLGSEV